MTLLVCSGMPMDDLVSPAKMTLGLAQALYERHKVLTYPRTDARALPEDYISTVKDTLGEMKDSQYGLFASQILKSDWVKPNKRIFNNSKISDHFAIIPTSFKPKKLNEAEQKLYDLVTKAFSGNLLSCCRISRNYPNHPS